MLTGYVFRMFRKDFCSRKWCNKMTCKNPLELFQGCGRSSRGKNNSFVFIYMELFPLFNVGTGGEMGMTGTVWQTTSNSLVTPTCKGCLENKSRDPAGRPCLKEPLKSSGEMDWTTTMPYVCLITQYCIREPRAMAWWGRLVAGQRKRLLNPQEFPVF